MTESVVVSKQFSWAMAHRLTRGYQGPCQNLHGHTYRCEVQIEATSLDGFGMAVDFGWIKKILGGWVDDSLDHATMRAMQDTDLLAALVKLGSNFFTMPEVYSNTTAEQIADMLFVQFRRMVATHDQGENRIRLFSVTVWETETSKATRSVVR